MESSAVTRQRNSAQTAPPPSTRERHSNDYARQASADDAVRQKERAQENREAMRRRAMADIHKQITENAFREMMAQERIEERRNMQAGVEKMVRTVVRKESAEAGQLSESAQPREASHTDNENSQAEYVREKLNKAYSDSNSDSPREKELRPSQSELQHKRAVERYQQDSTRNSIDRAVELVV